ncbi:MAG: hypothetical protein J1F11_12990 [Oscillospiraceae bacterium]|nr:hypothetical protein [Oscillospiraceae bacterium]
MPLDETAKIVFEDSVSIDELREHYNIVGHTVVNVGIGYDNTIYMLMRSDIPAAEEYSVIEIYADWESGAIIDSAFYKLGKHEHEFRYIQPIGDKLLLLGARSYYLGNLEGEKNAVIIDKHGEVSDRFCFGDGIEDCIVLSDGRIVTSYFDEGVYGNYGWRDPIGKRGLIVWNDKGEIIWQAGQEHGISDCDAINIDDRENLWFYYFEAYNLVRTDFRTEKIYTPGIKGANRFLFTKDMQYVIFNGEYDDYGRYYYALMNYEKIGDFKPVKFIYCDREDPIAYTKFRASKAVVVTSKNRLFAKEITVIN